MAGGANALIAHTLYFKEDWHTGELVLEGGRYVLFIVQEEKLGLRRALRLGHMTPKGLSP